MKIITPGALPQEKTYRTTCTNCGCVFEFKRKEAKRSPDQRDGDALVIPCPTSECNTQCWVTP